MRRSIAAMTTTSPPAAAGRITAPAGSTAHRSTEGSA
jgi:hypothetical protein